MKVGAATAAALVFVMSCAGNPTAGGTAPPPMASGSASSERLATASPSAAASATQLACPNGFTSQPDMVLVLFSAGATRGLEVLDTTNPLKPRLLCTLIPADGGQFGSSSHEVEFWLGNVVRLADLTAGTMVPIAEVPRGAVVGAYSRSHGLTVYDVPGQTDDFTRHLLQINGRDRTLYAQAPIGGHGGPPCGPYAQLQFSPDGTELLDYTTFRPMSGPANLLLFGSDGSPLFEQTGQSYGLWAPAGHVMFFGVFGLQGFTGEIDRIDASGQPIHVASGRRDICWPAMAPDGRSILFDAYDSSAPGQATGGLPHLWRVDLATGVESQLTTAVTSHPVFVRADVVWVEEEKPCECGPAGASAPYGVILAHDLVKGTDAPVDETQAAPGVGVNVLDGRFSQP